MVCQHNAYFNKHICQLNTTSHSFPMHANPHTLNTPYACLYQQLCAYSLVTITNKKSKTITDAHSVDADIQKQFFQGTDLDPPIEM